MSISAPPFTPHFATLAAAYDVVLCDVWGVVHNSIVAFADACTALERFRAQGGTVVLITNAPRPSTVVMTILDELKVPRAAYDAIVSSGDVTRAVIAARAGESAFHIGPPRDLPMFEGVDTPLASVERADYVVCSGLYDDNTETPQDYAALIAAMRGARPHHGVRQSGHRGRARREAGLLRRRDRRSLCGCRRQRALCRQALPADLRAGARGRGQTARAGDRACRGCWRSAIRCAPISRAPPPSASIACSSPPASMPRSWAGASARARAALDEIFAAAGLAPKAVTQRLVW